MRTLGWQRGEVVSFNNDRGFGFIRIEGESREAFVHYTAIEYKGYRFLTIGETVEADDIRQEERGLKAYRVRVIERKVAQRTGAVRSTGKKYGFILGDDSKDYYFEMRDIHESCSQLVVGDRVTFEPFRHREGLAARTIRLTPLFARKQT